jgi:hypothetical protein
MSCEVNMGYGSSLLPDSCRLYNDSTGAQLQKYFTFSGVEEPTIPFINPPLEITLIYDPWNPRLGHACAGLAGAKSQGGPLGDSDVVLPQ